MRHDIKTIQPYFNDIWDGNKTAELRKNDRDYKVGDWIMMREWCPVTGAYSRRVILVEVTHIMSDEKFGLQPGYVMMSIKCLVKGTA